MAGALKSIGQNSDAELALFRQRVVDIVRDELQTGRALDSAVIAKIDSKWTEIERTLPEKVTARVEEKWTQLSADDGAVDKKIRDTIIRKTRKYWTAGTLIFGFTRNKP